MTLLITLFNLTLFLTNTDSYISKLIQLASGSGTVSKHSLPDLKVEGLSPASAAGT
jgi:hypothetical protein